MNCIKCLQPKPDESFIKANGKRMKWCGDCRKANGELSRAGNAAEVFGGDYASRHRNLKAIGFSSYAEYLSSDLWRSVRAKVFAAKGRHCHSCGKPAEQVHHNRYHVNDLTGKTIRYLVPVCRECHQSAEFANGKKVTVRQAKKRLRIRHPDKRRQPQSVIVDFSSM